MIPLWILFTLASAIVFSAKDILVKQLFNHHEMTPTNAVIQEYFGFIIITILFLPKVQFASFLVYWQLFVLKAIFVGSVSYMYFTLLEKHKITAVAPILNLSPAFLLLLSAVFLGEMVTPIQIGGVLLIVAATYYLQVVLIHHSAKKCHKKHWYWMKKKDVYFYGTILGLLVTISLVAIVDKMILTQVNWQTNMFFMSFIILIIYIIVKKPPMFFSSIKLFKSHPLTIVFTITNGISTILVLLAIAVPGSLVALVIPLRRTSTLFTSIFGGLLFHEDHLLKKVASIVIMLIGVTLILI